jgi:hypothetical protein
MTTMFDTTIAQQAIQPVVVVEIAFSSGIKYYAQTDLDFVTSGIAAKGSVIEMGPLRRSIHDYLSVYESNDVSLAFANTDAEFSKLLATDTIKNVSCKVWIGETSLSFSDFQKIISGKIDSYSLSNEKFFVIARDLFSSIPEYPKVGTLNLTDFPNAYPEHVGRPLPVCYGTHAGVDPATYEDDGAWPTSYIDNTAGSYKFLIAAHAIKSIDAVYGWGADGVVTETTLTATYGLQKFTAGTINGQTMAYLSFSTLPVDSSGYILDIRVDVKGKEFNGDGTGILMDNPVDVLNDLLTLYLGQQPLAVVLSRSVMLGDETLLPATYPTSLGTVYEGFAYLCDETTGKFSNNDAGYELTGDTELYTDPVWQRMEDLGYTARGGIIELVKSEEILLAFCQSFGMRLYENRDGSLALYLFDPVIYGSLPSFSEEDDILAGSWEIDFQAGLQMTQQNQIVNRANFAYLFNWRRNTFEGADKIEDLASQTTYGDIYPLDLEMKWNGTRDGARDVVNRILFQFANPVAACHFTTPLRGTVLELGGKIAVTHHEAPSAAGTGWVARTCELQDLEYDFENMNVKISALDIASMEIEGFVLGDDTTMAANWTAAQGTTDELLGYLCDETTGEFGNGEPGKSLY